MYNSLVKSISLTVHNTKNMHNYSQYCKILTQRNSHLLQFIKSLVPQTYQFIVTILSLCQLFHYCCTANLSFCYCTGSEAKNKIVVVCASGFIYLFTSYPARQSFTRVWHLLKLVRVMKMHNVYDMISYHILVFISKHLLRNQLSNYRFTLPKNLVFTFHNGQQIVVNG